MIFEKEDIRIHKVQINKISGVRFVTLPKDWCIELGIGVDDHVVFQKVKDTIVIRKIKSQ